MTSGGLFLIATLRNLCKSECKNVCANGDAIIEINIIVCIRVYLKYIGLDPLKK